ncbi:unnamed protein product (macronuclear) [Paramecium tetraurelia]|uniref:Uncharacterized protein n=1 Tax=Paramecium tetraurelia TaxID=5888 RepID=A0DRJ9_PARTE|nr:uncharacterized protein GSPATT00019384001 [Paramecium tetraurelia]CAK85666.1 unnamed protein product [Paramecium tetraurelia]|eukprot:XP_001453063.1 hypothetical protein (macronuclear) [Paramecium tetraurelia strain d4-2]
MLQQLQEPLDSKLKNFEQQQDRREQLMIWVKLQKQLKKERKELSIEIIKVISRTKAEKRIK